MSPEINISLGIIAMILVGDSWYHHFIVKDGLARQILLWGNGLIFGMMFFRTLGYILSECEILNIYTSRTWNQYVILFIYAIILGQWILQRKKF